MSSHLFIGDHCWNQSSGTVRWALDVIADHVTHPGAVAELREFSGGLIFVEDFGRSFGPEVSEQIVEVIRTRIRPAALAEPEGEVRDYTVRVADELVEMANRWRGFAIEAGEA
ncbi:hypothetical protein [Lentzea sp. NBRC 102530]|uniref:hypothetical protein n=1 Tax=Lentzea sp. NBRC 102530 TaxID=3032201 RepID=UPI0024A3E237|nr:hypothetical protein [Lentzea sp. NBRC 102530]GLY53263.1 hypothetical protein Lesp01_69190 [Lentzea sp. NBRC 102530]